MKRSMFSSIDMQLHLWMIEFGPWIYLVLFSIIFCETGVVVMPFLPGDSLLFTLGALTATTAADSSGFNFWLLGVILSIAAILGDSVNYAIGRNIGPKIFSKPERRWLKREHLLTTQKFYERHGGKTIILARFLPILRTFAPFVAGIGKMNYARFAFFNISGGVFWIFFFLLLGRLFGNIPVVQKNFEFVIIGIIVFSCFPIVWRSLKKS